MYRRELIQPDRERNPDLLTALSLLTLGTYNRLPTSLTESFLPKPPLSNALILETIRRLNKYLLFRIRCVDHVPSEMTVYCVQDGRIYVGGGGRWGWKAELTVVGFGTDEGESRWWLVGVEWGWRNKEEELDDLDGRRKRPGKKFTGDERQQILDIANLEVLAPKPVEVEKPPDKLVVVANEPVVGDGPKVGTPGSGMGTPGSRTRKDLERSAQTGIDDIGSNKVDAPLIRVYNLLR